jgi:hypothetical protein
MIDPASSHCGDGAAALPRRGMRSASILALLVALFAAAARAQSAAAPQMATVVVPVVGSVDGPAGMRWKTDVTLYNDQRVELTVALTLPAAPDQPAIVTSIAPGDSLRFADVVGEAFGMTSALSPLVISTLGRRSVAISATVYGVRGEEMFKPQPIAVEYGASYFPLRVLSGLSFSDDYRTNIGIANLGDHPAEVALALQRLPGRNMAVTRVVVGANSLWHASLNTFFPMIADGGDFTVVVETLQPETYVYASVIENATNSATFVQPTVGPLLAP